MATGEIEQTVSAFRGRAEQGDGGRRGKRVRSPSGDSALLGSSASRVTMRRLPVAIQHRGSPMNTSRCHLLWPRHSPARGQGVRPPCARCGSGTRAITTSYFQSHGVVLRHHRGRTCAITCPFMSTACSPSLCWCATTAWVRARATTLYFPFHATEAGRASAAGDDRGPARRSRVARTGAVLLDTQHRVSPREPVTSSPGQRSGMGSSRCGTPSGRSGSRRCGGRCTR